MKIAEADILFLAGLGDSGPGHWQRRWQARMTNAQWVEQADWHAPDLNLWCEAIEQAVLMATRPVVFVAHSLGVVALVHAAPLLAGTKVRGAFLAAPPDLDENDNAPRAALPFANVPRNPLPFPSVFVASDNDPYCTLERAGDLANCWGSDFHIASEAGHINVTSGHGPWPEGLMMFTRLMKLLKP